MPFKKVGANDYVSPSGRHFNKAQVALYHAHDGFPRDTRGKFGGGNRGVTRAHREAASVRHATMPKRKS